MSFVDFEIPVERVCFLGAFLPRHSRTAGETSHLLNAFAAEYSNCECLGVAMSDVQRRYAYPSRVHFEIAQANQGEYSAAAEYLNLNNVDLVCVYHDFEIFDGEAGGYLLTLLQALKFPAVTLLPRLPAPASPAQQRVIAALICSFSPPGCF